VGAERSGGAPAVSPPIAEAPRLESSRAASRGSFATATRPAGDPAAARSEAAAAAAPLAIGRFADLIELAAQKRDLGVKAALERDVRLVRYEDGRLEIALETSAAKTLVNDLSRKLSQWTNRRWMVVVSAEAGEPSLRSQSEARAADLKTGVRADPLVQAVLTRFPGAEIVDVREAGSAAEPASGAADGAIPEPPPVDDGADWQADDQDEDS
jgi:DNA polymerase-3 subunit gamma/tau